MVEEGKYYSSSSCTAVVVPELRYTEISEMRWAWYELVALFTEAYIYTYIHLYFTLIPSSLSRIRACGPKGQAFRSTVPPLATSTRYYFQEVSDTAPHI